MPPNRTYPCSHICLDGEALTRAIVVLFYGHHQVGEVMHARYPDQVGGDNLDIHSVYPGVLVGQVATRWRVIAVLTRPPNHDGCGVNEATQPQGYPRQCVGESVGR